MHRPFLAIVSSLVIAAAGTASAAGPAEYVLTARGSIEVGADGTVHDYALENTLAPPVASAIDRHVRSWRFHPVEVDGRPVIAKSRMHLSLRAVPAGENLELHVDEVSFGGAHEPAESVRKQHPLRYPKRALQSSLGARVLLAVRTDATGKVIDVHPYQTSLSQRMSDGQAARWRKVFEDATARSVQAWTFEPGGSIDGTPVASSFLMPVEYTIGHRRPDPDAWRAYVPGPVAPAPWVDVAPAQSAQLASLADGETLPLDTWLVLRTPATPTGG